MCGIFGISAKLEGTESKKIKLITSDLRELAKISEKRGSDTFGFVLKFNSKNFLYKINQEPSKAIYRKDLKKFLEQSINNTQKSNITLIGQTRLVTNGSKFSITNNQPLHVNNIIGVHNGIFVNFTEPRIGFFDDSKKNGQERTKTRNYESILEKSDSLRFYENLSNFAKGKSFLNNYLKLLSNTSGSYSLSYILKNSENVFLSSNCGSLYYYYDKKNNFFTFASEKNILAHYIKNSLIIREMNFSYDQNNLYQCLNSTIVYNSKKNYIEVINHNSHNSDYVSEKDLSLEKVNSLTITNYEDDEKRLTNLRRCTKCILPSTYPYIKFNNDGVCNFCTNYKKQIFFGEERLNQVLSKFRSKNGQPDCLVGLSGGRDSSYGLHLLKTKYNMNPVAYTYDWGLTTDISRINQTKICGKLGIEHIIRSANIEKKRSFVRENIFAWLKRPHLGMLPIVQAGDKSFIDYGRILSKELNIKLAIHCTGHQLEQREFFLGFLGVNQKLSNNQSMYSYGFLNKIKTFFLYGFQFFLNPSYFNSAFFDNLNGFFASFVRKDDFLHLYNYEKWNENKITTILNDEYNWAKDISYGKNQWRMGDGQTAFNNFVYYAIAGFSEYDNFRSNQIREGMISRNEALILSKEDNKIKYDTLKIFSETVGFNLDYVLSKVSCIPKIY